MNHAIKVFLAFIVLLGSALGQGSGQGNMIVVPFSGAPTGVCAFYKYFAQDLVTGDFYNCFGTTWHKLNGTGGGGTPGGSPDQLQYNLAGAFAGIPDGVLGQVLVSNGPGAPAGFVDPIVSGAAAEGATPVNNPVWVAGKGADGFIHSIRMANDGTVRVDPTGTTVQPVSGTFFQATQPVSGTFWQATQPVSGTFFQATQPVSGTFWQATQPVSGTVAATESGTWNVNATLAAETTKVIGTVNIAASQTVGIAAGSAVIGHVIVDTAPTTAVTNAGLTNLDVALSTRTKPADQQHAIIDSGTTTVTQGTGTNLHVVVDTAPSTAVTNTGLTNLDVALSTRTKPSDQQHVIVDTIPTTAVTQSTSPWSTAGNVASGASDSGNPVKVGGVYNSNYNLANPLAPLSLATGQRADLQVDSFGRLLVIDPETPLLLAALRVSPKLSPRIAGSFNRPITSTGDALDVYNKYPAPSFDPCSGPNKANIPISVTANAKLVSSNGPRIRICSIFLLSTSAETFSLVEGSGSTCGTGTAGVIGSTTAANGPALPANGGLTLGNGAGSVAMQAVAGNDICILISGSTLIAGNLTYAF